MEQAAGPGPVRSLPPAAPPLAGARALVTGSSAGTGMAVARRLLDDGASVVVNSRDPVRAKATADALAPRASGTAAVLGRGANVALPEEATALVDWSANALGGLDILVNNAGTTMTAPSLELPVQDWQRALDLDLTAPFVCSQAAARHMLPAGGGVIVNVSSILGHTGIPQRAAYAAAKHGLAGLTRVLASEWASGGVRVVSVDPGFVATELVRKAQQAGTAPYTYDDLNGRTPLGRVADPDEIAAAVAFLAGPDARYITGTSLVVDGGWLAFGGWGSA